MRTWIGSALLQIMACRLFGAKPLSEPMLDYHQLDPWEQTVSESWIIIHNTKFVIKKMNLKISSAKWPPFKPRRDELKATSWWNHIQNTFQRHSIIWSTIMVVLFMYRCIREGLFVLSKYLQTSINISNKINTYIKRGPSTFLCLCYASLLNDIFCVSYHRRLNNVDYPSSKILILFFKLDVHNMVHRLCN